MHPVVPLSVELAWADETATFWDSQDGRNYRYQWSMIRRGWDSFLKVGVSEAQSSRLIAQPVD